jgi:hypothetical protein
MGRPRASLLAPLWSEATARVLAAALLAPESLHIQAISDRTELPYSVVQREVDRLEKARLLKSTKFGQSRVVRPDERHPLLPELRALLLKAYGPIEALSTLLDGERGVESAYLHGSWAARYLGEPGPPPADVDVILVGNVSPRRREELEAEAQDLLGQPVQIETALRNEWDADGSAFIRTVKSRPIVPIRIGGTAER